MTEHTEESLRRMRLDSAKYARLAALEEVRVIVIEEREKDYPDLRTVRDRIDELLKIARVPVDMPSEREVGG